MVFIKYIYQNCNQPNHVEGAPANFLGPAYHVYPPRRAFWGQRSFFPLTRAAQAERLRETRSSDSCRREGGEKKGNRERTALKSRRWIGFQGDRVKKKSEPCRRDQRSRGRQNLLMHLRRAIGGSSNKPPNARQKIKGARAEITCSPIQRRSARLHRPE
ncbi:hypothetical protein NDU88_003693 [Pleurodeles waltl]|uniref:Uncharacterized protein n=1 Tax=Pleurodeles waltl TaxID=8319 RepID=A0AAV7SGP3_PLEWA|nr:hypothetical protein NDU88_003693 [Pleurodeles waltl]